MTVEQLLKPRYKVIADYPISPYKVGDLMKQNGSTSFFITTHKDYVDGTAIDVEDNVFGPTLKKYPHLFRKLHWWEDRTPEEMPEYVRGCKSVKRLLQIEDHGSEHGPSILCEGETIWSPIWMYLPATETEYNEYLKTLNP